MARKTYILIEDPTGERMLVKSLSGHEGWTVVKDRVPEPPNDHCRLCPKGRWVEDGEAKERAELRRLIADGRLAEALERLQAKEDGGRTSAE